MWAQERTEKQKRLTRGAKVHKRTIHKRSNDPDNHDGVVTHLEPDVLEYAVKKHYYEQS